MSQECHKADTRLLHFAELETPVPGGPDPQRKPRISLTVTPYETPQIRPPHLGLDPWRWLRKQVLQLLQNHSLRRPFLRRHA